MKDQSMDLQGGIENLQEKIMKPQEEEEHLSGRNMGLEIIIVEKL